MSLEKSSVIPVTQAEYYSIKNGALPEKLKDSGYSLEEVQAKVQSKEVEIIKEEPKKMSVSDVNNAL